MGRKNKRARWAELDRLDFVFQPPMNEVFGHDFRMKGKWYRFFGNKNPVILELGCGKGEYTIGLARKYPDRNFIGIDIKGARMWRGAVTARDEELKNVAFVRTRIEWISSFFAPGEISEIWLTFPDPQPKKRQAKKRLTHPNFLNKYQNILTPKGKIHLKTDNKSLFTYTRNLAFFNKLTIITETEDLYHDSPVHPASEIQTFYERIFLEQGMKIHYIQFYITPGTRLKDLPDEQN